MKTVLALDVSGKCTGWCFGAPGQKPTSGTIAFKRDGDTEDEVFMRALTWLNDQMRVMQPDIVAIEAPIKASGGGNTNPASQTMLIGLQAVLRAVVKARLPGRAVLVAASTARKTFTGKGVYEKGTAKDAVMAEVLRRGFLDAADLQPDRCDAVCLWTHQAAQQLPELAFRPTRTTTECGQR